MKRIYLLISRNRKSLLFNYLNRIVRFLYFALENKNNDHHTNGEFWLMKKLSESGLQIIFDVGANIGIWSIEAHKIFLNSSIYSFEPMPEVFARLQENVAGRGDIHIFNFALAKEKGTLSFNYYPNEILFSSIYSHHKGSESKTIQVNTIDGDSFCKENKIQVIDFLKLDVEGSEHLVLEGFKQMLTSQKIKVIQFEYGVLSIQSKFLLQDFYNLFYQYGYTLGKIYPNHIDFTKYDWTLENFIGPNYIAVRNSEEALINSLK